jgi:hypothetical protein
MTISFSQPVSEIGAFFWDNDDWRRLSIFGANDEPLGSLDVATKGTWILDEFVGLRSSSPIYSARFERGLNGAVVLDDLSFTVIPEPSTYAMVAIGALCALVLRRTCAEHRRKNGASTNAMKSLTPRLHIQRAARTLPT